MLTTVLEKIGRIIHRNHKAILVTFEIFWILIFLLEKMGGGQITGIPQFIYVNF